MGDLTIALAVLGGIVLAGVVAHGAWQARRANPMPPLQRSASPSDAAHALREPAFDAPAAEVAIDEGSAPDALALRPARRPVAHLDALVDAIATLALDTPVSGEAVLMHLPPTRRAGSKPFLIEGRDTESRDWETPCAGRRYSELQAGVQLANRTGALNEIEYSEFVQKVQAFADALGAMADFPDMLEAVARARELDAFAGEHDAQLAVHLQARSVAWSVGYIQQHAARHGFVAGAVPGRLVLPSPQDGAPPVLTLTFDPQAVFADDHDRTAVRSVVLSFDVPQTDAEAEPFAVWQATAQALSLGMDAAVVDDNDRPLSADGFDAIGSELRKLYDKLEARGLGAGSAAARRLFS